MAHPCMLPAASNFAQSDYKPLTVLSGSRVSQEWLQKHIEVSNQPQTGLGSKLGDTDEA